MSDESRSQKKRRRSSLAASKNKLDLSPSVGKGLYRSVDVSLSAEERIKELCKLCSQCAVDHIAVDSDEARKCVNEVSEMLVDCLDSPEIKEAIYAACHVGNLQPNPDNLEMDIAIKDMEARINRLKKEEEDWNQLFQDLETKAEDAERLVDKKTISESELTEEQQELSKNYLPDLTDLDVTRKEVTNALRKTRLMVREHETCVSRLWNIKEEISSTLDKKLAELHNKTLAVQATPRTNCQNLLEFPTPPSEPR